MRLPTVLMRSACGVFMLVVLKDAILLSFLDILPVCLEGDAEHGIPAEDKLRRSCLVCGVDGGIDCADSLWSIYSVGGHCFVPSWDAQCK